MKKRTQLIISLATVLTLVCISILSFGQNEDANPYGGIYYNDHFNYRMYGADVLTRTTRAAAEARTNVIKGDHCYDTLAQEILFYNGSVWIGLDGGRNTLGEAYDQGGAGAGREIDAVDGAVKISGEDGLLVTGTFGSGEDSEWSGAGTGMFFNPKKAAFRAGYVDGTQWDNANIGDYSFSVGYSNEASGEKSIAIGEGLTSSGETSVAIGIDAFATGDFAVAIGNGNTASGQDAYAMGNGNTASGERSTSMGNGNTASGNVSTSMGEGTTAESYAETVIGLNNTDYTPTSTNSWEATDRLFVIGNGTSSGTRSDALVMLKDGSTTLNGSLAIIDGNEADGAVLTSDASGSATWQTPQETTLYSDVTEATTTTTDWETLATYNIAANTLSANGNSLEIHMAHVGAMPADSIRLVLGSTNVFLDNNAGQNNDNIKTTIARQSAGNQLFFTGNDFGTGTEDETTQLTLSFQAKSVTIGNQSLKYFKVKRSE